MIECIKMKRIILSLLCVIAVSAYAKNTRDRHESVDLGLSVRWATTNIGARKPYDYGAYYAWAEVESKEFFSSGNYKYGNGNPYTKYESKYGKPMLDIHEYITRNTYDIDADTADVASFNWGGDWRLPSKQEMQELIDSCDWAMDECDGIKGWRVTSRKEGYTDRSIFLPYINSSASYMSGDIALDWSKRNTSCASLYITENPISVSDGSSKRKKVYYRIQEYNRANSYYVRPVQK